MTVRELIESLQKCPPESEAMVELKLDPCDTCAKINHYCDIAHMGSQFAEAPYYHEASDETRIGIY